MCREVAFQIDIAFCDRRSHEAVSKDEVNPAFFGVLVGVTGGHPRLPMAFGCVIPDVSPTMFLH